MPSMTYDVGEEEPSNKALQLTSGAMEAARLRARQRLEVPLAAERRCWADN
jgi:hypothetical protein